MLNAIFCLIFLCVFPMHAMEKHISGYWSDEAHEQELLLPKQEKKKKEETQDDSIVFREGDCPLKKLDPEIVAHIFSFLPISEQLCNLMRLDGFQPTTDPVEASPFYAEVKRIRHAHAHYILQKCQDQPIKQGRAIKVAALTSLICSFMRITKYKKNTFFWSDVHELNALISDHVSAEVLGVNEKQLKNVLHRFVAETEEHGKFIYSNTEKKKSCHDLEPQYVYYLARQTILEEFIRRIRSNQHWYDYDEEKLHDYCYEATAPPLACSCSGCCLLTTGLTAFFCGVHAPIGYIVGTGAMNIISGFCASVSLGHMAWEKKIYYELKPGRDKVWQSFLLLSAAYKKLETIKK